MSELLDQMDHAPMTSLHRRLAWAAGLGIFLDGYDLVIIGVVLLQLKAHWHLSPHQIGILGSAALAGAFVGALAGGRIADRYGRKAVYIIDLLTFLVAAILCGISWNIYSLAVFRFILGIGVGADYPISATYLAEFMPAQRRGSVLSWTFGLWVFGAIAAGLVGFICLGDPANGWRWMFMFGALPAVFVVYLRGNLPESPRWYLRNNMPEKAAQVVARLNPGIHSAGIQRMVRELPPQSSARVSPWRLFRPPLLRATLLVCMPWFVMDLLGYYLTIYTPLILGELGFGSAGARVLGGAILNMSFLVGYIPLALLIDRIGRIWPQIIGFLGSAAALWLVGMASVHVHRVAHFVAGHVAFTMEATGGTLALIFIGMLLSQISNSFGPGSTTYILASEVYPTDVRATGHGFATAFSRLGAVASTYFLPIIQVRITQQHFFFLLGGLSVLGAVLTWLFRVNTTAKPLLQDISTAKL